MNDLSEFLLIVLSAPAVAAAGVALGGLILAILANSIASTFDEGR